MASNKKGKEPKDKGTSLLEWVSGVLGLLITLALLGFIVAEAVRTSPHTPPLLEVTPTAIAAANGVYVVEVRVANSSGQTAAAVSIEGTLEQGGATVETSSATLSYVPGNSTRKAGLIFTRDPRHFQLRTRATGYEEP